MDGSPTIRPLSLQPIPEQDLVENSQGGAKLQLLPDRHFAPQLVEEVQRLDWASGQILDADKAEGKKQRHTAK